MSTQSERAHCKSEQVRECIGWKLTGFSLEDREGFKQIRIGLEDEVTGKSKLFSMYWMEPEVELKELMNK